MAPRLNVDPQTFFTDLKFPFREGCFVFLGHPSVLLQDPVDAVAGDAEDGLGGAAEVPDAAVPGLSLQPLGGRVAGQAEGGAALVGLVQARQAPVRQPLVQGPETGGNRVSG